MGRAANVQGASPLVGSGVCFHLPTSAVRKFYLLNFPQMVNIFICSPALTSTSLEYREKGGNWFHCTFPPLILSPWNPSCKCALRVDWPEGWRSTGSSWVQEWAIHPGYLQEEGEGGAGRRSSTCLLNKSSLSPFCSCSPINQRGPCECSYVLWLITQHWQYTPKLTISQRANIERGSTLQISTSFWSIV